MRALLLFFSVALALCASGCLRTKFDLCASDPPDPQCAFLDASNDGGVDAATDDASLDATTD